MMGSSRESYASLRDGLDSRRTSGDLARLSQDLLAASDLLAGDTQLRTTLADAGQPVATRVGIVQRLFTDHVSPDAVAVIGDAASARWPSPHDLVEVLEGLGAQAAFMAAQDSGDLDALEDQLFEFRQAVSGSAPLQMALTNPAIDQASKSELVESLLGGRATPQARTVLAYSMSHLRGRRADSVIEDLIDLAAEQRGRAVAEVRVALPLSDEQEWRLAAALSRLQGREVRLNVALDPAVIGGISVKIGSQVMDATVATRLEQARRALVP